MDNASLIEKTKNHVKVLCEKDASGHDWWHIYRVWSIAKHIAEQENANAFTVELAALLHDLDDWKLNDKSHAPLPNATQWLKCINVDQNTLETVCNIIHNIGFKGGGKDRPVLTLLEVKIVQDADRLDAIGAIGIARAFAYGGHENRLIHDPNISAIMHQDFSSYQKNQSTTLNHFYEKLLLLKDGMHTKAARKIAEQRHQFMEQFIRQFLNEWDAFA